MHRYRVVLANDISQPIVVTSHIYATGTASDGGCGCRTTRPAAALPLLVAFGLVLRRRRAT
jgi:MYXO-CTERM domain-containing protein